MNGWRRSHWNTCGFCWLPEWTVYCRSRSIWMGSDFSVPSVQYMKWYSVLLRLINMRATGRLARCVNQGRCTALPEHCTGPLYNRPTSQSVSCDLCDLATGTWILSRYRGAPSNRSRVGESRSRYSRSQMGMGITGARLWRCQFSIGKYLLLTGSQTGGMVCRLCLGIWFVWRQWKCVWVDRWLVWSNILWELSWTDPFKESGTCGLTSDGQELSALLGFWEAVRTIQRKLPYETPQEVLPLDLLDVNVGFRCAYDMQ